MDALLIIGLQVDLLPGGPAEVPGSQELIPIINQLTSRFDVVVAANFWMQPDHISFATSHPWRRPGQEVQIQDSSVRLHHIFGVPGSFGAEFIPGLITQQIAFIAHMGSDSKLPPHSAFFDAGNKRDTGLASFLKEKQVTDVYLAGMPLEREVKNSALDCASLGFQAFIVKEACAGTSYEVAEKALGDLLEQNTAVVSLQHLDTLLH